MLVTLVLATFLRPVAANHDLDFWLGEWTVYSGGQVAGKDVVNSIQGGWAITETWTGTARNDTGTSFFYYMPALKRWKQVWVTPNGVYKEKYSEPVPNGIRFVGKIFFQKGKTIADRTTLTKLAGGQVHQVIESSRDGKTWEVGFDAVYKRSRT